MNSKEQRVPLKAHLRFLSVKNIVVLTLFLLSLPLLTLLLLVLISIVYSPGGLTKEQIQEVHNKNAIAVALCKAKWKDKRWVHIRGSEYALDQTKLPWQMEFGSTWSDPEDCGAAAILGLFFWTGKEIVPERIGFESPGYNAKFQNQKGWYVIDVKALLGAPADAVRRAKQHPETLRPYPEPPPRNWPPELLIRLKNYPDLIALVPDPQKGKGLVYLDFILRDWPRDDGSPRIVFCDVGRHVVEMTRSEIENLDFGRQRGYCQMEFTEFGIHGGRARLNWGFDSMPQITPILHALHDYLNANITKEKP